MHDDIGNRPIFLLERLITLFGTYQPDSQVCNYKSLSQLISKFKVPLVMCLLYFKLASLPQETKIIYFGGRPHLFCPNAPMIMKLDTVIELDMLAQW